MARPWPGNPKSYEQRPLPTPNRPLLLTQHPYNSGKPDPRNRWHKDNSSLLQLIQLLKMSMPPPRFLYRKDPTKKALMPKLSIKELNGHRRIAQLNQMSSQRTLTMNSKMNLSIQRRQHIPVTSVIQISVPIISCILISAFILKMILFKQSTSPLLRTCH